MSRGICTRFFILFIFTFLANNIFALEQLNAINTNNWSNRNISNSVTWTNYTAYYRAYAHFYSISCNTSPADLTGSFMITPVQDNNYVSQITLNWANSTSTVVNLSKYNIYRSSVSGSNYVKIGEVPAGMEDVVTNTSNRLLTGDDINTIRSLLNPINKFYFFGVNQTANWSLSTNGYVARNNVTGSNSYHNNWERFIGTGANKLGACICPLWCDLMARDSTWSESGVFYNAAYNPTRLIYTWIMFRYNVLDDAYKLQTVLYETGDIAIRYNLINPRALVAGGNTDKPVNTSIHHTVGISNGDGLNYLYYSNRFR